MIHLHVVFCDDEPDIREIIDISLALDSLLVVRGCASGDEALSTAVDWRPDLILLDVMMPGLDGPATLARLREDRRTSIIPVVFMTARTQARECERFKVLGASGVIPKPFDPMTLAAQVRSFVPAEAALLAARNEFLRRLEADSTALAACRSELAQARREPALARIKELAHALAGASGIYGFAGLSCESVALEEAVDGNLAGVVPPVEVDHALDRVLARIAAH
jgi:CheY-like chemotaxis protein